MSSLLDYDSPELTDEVRKRLSTILRDYYACPPTHEGWRKLVLILLLQHTSEFRSEKGQLSGTKNYGTLLWMAMLMDEKPGMKRVDAAKAVVKRLKALKKEAERINPTKAKAKRLNTDKGRKLEIISSKTLQNQFAEWKDNESSKLARSMKRYEAIWNALMKAAVQLEQNYEDEPYYGVKGMK